LAASRVFACFVDVQFEHPLHLADEKIQGLSEFTGTFKENWCDSFGPRLDPHCGPGVTEEIEHPRFASVYTKLQSRFARFPCFSRSSFRGPSDF
jgi:hypothetical protein